MNKSKPCTPDKMTGISEEVYLMQARQLPDNELRKLKNKIVVKTVLKEREISKKRNRTVRVSAELNRLELQKKRPVTADELLADVSFQAT